MSRPDPTEDLLFEIGTEEIPSGYLAGALECIRSRAPELLTECGYQYARLIVNGTPRRLVLCAEGFQRKARESAERFGPYKEQCYQNGSATPALLGFLKGAGAQEPDLKWKETPKGPRAYVLVQKEVKPLRYFFEELPRRIEFPKLMRWSPGRSTRQSLTGPGLLLRAIRSYWQSSPVRLMW